MMFIVDHDICQCLLLRDLNNALWPALFDESRKGYLMSNYHDMQNKKKNKNNYIKLVVFTAILKLLCFLLSL